MAEQYSKRDVTRFAAFLGEIKGDLEADGGDCMVCLSSAIGLMKRPKPADVLPPINPTHQGKLAILLCIHGEAERFPDLLEAMLDPEFGEISLYVGRPDSLKNIVFRYTIAKEIRSRYKDVDDYDPYTSDCYKLLEKLKARLPSDVIVDLGFVEFRPFIEEKIVEAVNNGADKVICVHTLIQVSVHTDEIERRIGGLGLRGKGIEVYFTEPLWNDEKFIQHLCNRVLEIIGDEDKSKVGVAYIGYGIPDVDISPGKFGWAQMETENRCAQAYLKKLDEYGIKNTTVGFVHYSEPDMPTCAKTLAEKGARLMVFHWFHTARTLISLVDIPKELERIKSRLPEGTRVVMVGAEADQPGYVDVLVNQIEKARKKFGI